MHLLEKDESEVLGQLKWKNKSETVFWSTDKIDYKPRTGTLSAGAVFMYFLQEKNWVLGQLQHQRKSVFKTLDDQ